MIDKKFSTFFEVNKSIKSYLFFLCHWIKQIPIKNYKSFISSKLLSSFEYKKIKNAPTDHHKWLIRNYQVFLRQINLSDINQKLTNFEQNLPIIVEANKNYKLLNKNNKFSKVDESIELQSKYNDYLL